MALALTPEESLKYRIAEGKYQKFMAWMGNAVMGRTNWDAILVFEVASTEVAVQFLSKCLPGMRCVSRFRCNQTYKDNVIVYKDAYPRRSRQRDCVRSLMLKSNVVLVNPPVLWLEHTSLPILRVEMMIDEEAMHLASTFLAMVVKFYAVSNVDSVVALNDALAEKSLRSFRDLIRSYKDLGGRPEPSVKNMLALAHAYGTDIHVNHKNQTIQATSLGGPPGDASTTVPRFVVEFYEKGAAMIQWLSRCAMGIPALNMLMSIEDPTTTTIDMIRTVFGDQRVAYVTDANLSSLYYISEPSYFILYVFEYVSMPFVDLLTLCKHSSVLFVQRESTHMQFDPRIFVLRSKYKSTTTFPASKLSRDGFGSYAQHAYDVTIKEPACIAYIEKALACGRYKWNTDLSIDDLVLDFTAWCALQNLPPWMYFDITLTQRNIKSTVDTYFRCSIGDAYIRFSGSRKVILG